MKTKNRILDQIIATSITLLIPNYCNICANLSLIK